MKLKLLTLLALVAAAALGCKKKEVPVVAATNAAAQAGNLEPVPADPPAPATAVSAPAAATATAEAEPKEADLSKNAWNLPPRGTSAKDGDRCYVLMAGRDRTYADARKPYNLFAQDIGEVKGDAITIKELTGGTYRTTGLFVIPAGSQPGEVAVGDMVLAEWASELKHATVTKVEGEKMTVRYTDLPDSWPEVQLVKVLSPREVTKQKEGLHPGNFAIAKGEQGRDELLLLIAESGDNWLVRKFSHLVAATAKSQLRPIPLKPALKVGQLVEVPWVGQMYQGKVVKVSGTRVEVRAEGVATKEPVVASLGQVAPVEAKAKPDDKAAKPAQ
ncbi:MAG: hypothetical protein FJ100_17665 [Deltaproteobacteria bacterium]|nr:hypothetical protein [Deltaproteobacteria bacterium]